MFMFTVSSSTAAASDRAVGVNLVAEFPATGALDEVDLLDPLGAEAGGVEEEDRFANQGLEVGFIWVQDTEADIAMGFSWDTVSVGPCWSFYKYGIFKDFA